jgi:DNA-binding NarL/FixJ family response regulator
MQVVIVEDHAFFREYLRKICRDSGLDVLAEASNGKRGLSVIRRLKPDLVLLDLELPALDGVGVIELLDRHAVPAKVLVVSAHCEPYTVFRLEKLRVAGYIDKGSGMTAVLGEAIAAIRAGHTYFSEPFRQSRLARHCDQQSFDKILSAREQQTLCLIAQPMTDAEIGARLRLATATAEKHRFNVMRKLCIRPMARLIRYARKMGFGLWIHPAMPAADKPPTAAGRLDQREG